MSEIIQKYAIEVKYAPSDSWHLSNVTDTRDEAEEIKREREQFWSFDTNTKHRVVLKSFPKDKTALFDHLVNLLINDGITIDDTVLDGYALHIEWGDWKHSHLHADCILSLFGFTLIKERVTEEDGSDCYSAWRTYKAD